ncbi:hypothetical protein GIS00_03245 [Nakamurella sp. YIM 132087]|uniref:SCO6045-like C-terminal domain-containing protein n=1 Tax=Nakamurella alba TaxID=2665158 RepID=A0A7K1FFW5_9ACTN|nr:hypothetical protein [Nakamurella alba]MTD12960.1 hypothetical protein [Nakamurella alba]
MSPDLARAQAALVAGVTGTGPVPPGFDAQHLEVARKALLRKRAGEVRARWPYLAADLGTQFLPMFVELAAHRATLGSLRDGWDLAELAENAGHLKTLGRRELVLRRLDLTYDGSSTPRPRHGWIRTARAGRTRALQIGRRTWVRS